MTDLDLGFILGLTYVLIGGCTAGLVIYLAPAKWGDDTLFALSLLAFPFWPILGPWLVISYYIRKHGP